MQLQVEELEYQLSSLKVLFPLYSLYIPSFPKQPRCQSNYLTLFLTGDTQGTASGDKPAGSATAGAAGADKTAASYEKLKQDFHRKCDQNLRLKMKLDDMKFQLDFDRETHKRLEKSVEKLKAENSRLRGALFQTKGNACTTNEV